MVMVGKYLGYAMPEVVLTAEEHAARLMSGFTGM